MLWQSNSYIFSISTEVFSYVFWKNIWMLLRRILCCTKQQSKSSLQTVKDTVNKKSIKRNAYLLEDTQHSQEGRRYTCTMIFSFLDYEARERLSVIWKAFHLFQFMQQLCLLHSTPKLQNFGTDLFLWAMLAHDDLKKLKKSSIICLVWLKVY